MGCIIISAERVGEGLRAGGHRVGNGLRVMAERVGESLRVCASLVCDAGYPTIEIIPDHIWLTPGNHFAADVDVITRTDWEVLK